MTRIFMYVLFFIFCGFQCNYAYAFVRIQCCNQWCGWVSYTSAHEQPVSAPDVVVTDSSNSPDDSEEMLGALCTSLEHALQVDSSVKRLFHFSFLSSEFIMLYFKPDLMMPFRRSGHPARVQPRRRTPKTRAWLLLGLYHIYTFTWKAKLPITKYQKNLRRSYTKRIPPERGLYIYTRIHRRTCTHILFYFLSFSCYYISHHVRFFYLTFLQSISPH
jgi:hypothetical protein